MKRRALDPDDLNTNGEPFDCLALIRQYDRLNEWEELAASHLLDQGYQAPARPYRRESVVQSLSLPNWH